MEADHEEEGADHKARSVSSGVGPFSWGWTAEHLPKKDEAAPDDPKST